MSSGVVAAGNSHRSGERGEPGGHKTIDALPQPPAPRPPPRKHSAKTIALARRRYGDGARSPPPHLHAYCCERGLIVAASTLRARVLGGVV